MSTKEVTLDLKTKLEDEPILSVGNAGMNRVKALKEKGINTIEEFLNCDVRTLSQFEEGRRKYRIYQDVLSSKYLGTPLLRASYLDAKYKYGKSDYETGMVRTILMELGFLSTSIRRQVFRTMDGDPRLSRKNTKIIDILKNYFPVGEYSYKPLTEYYISYYDQNMSMDEAMQNPKKFLKNARKELAELVIKRDELDDQIQSLTERINAVSQGEENHEL